MIDDVRRASEVRVWICSTMVDAFADCNSISLPLPTSPRLVVALLIQSTLRVLAVLAGRRVSSLISHVVKWNL